jgi:hypothetical protein
MNNFGTDLEEGYLNYTDMKESIKYYKMSANLCYRFKVINYGFGFSE